MKYIFFVTLLTFITGVLCEYFDDRISLIKKYTDICEKVDINSLLNNRCLLNVYIKCLLDESACTKYGFILRQVIPEILMTTCSGCTKKQKQIVRNVMNHIYTTRKSDFENIFHQFDPELKYRAEMMGFMYEGDNSSDALNFNSTIPYRENQFQIDINDLRNI